MNKVLLLACMTLPWVLAGQATQDSVVQLTERPTELKFDSQHGYLKSVLKELKISEESQVLVFSKTSLQADHITRKTPRAIYFNQDTYVAWIPGAPLLEIMAVHPSDGIRFYTLENAKPMARATFQQETNQCFRCHGGRVEGISPTLFAQSSHVPESGYPRAFVRSVQVTPRTPIAQRWGGWYVSGQHGTMRHMGNVVSTGTDKAPKLDTTKGANATSLAKFVNLSKYPTPHSDIVALMVMEQQMYVQNIMSQTGLDLKGQKRVIESDVEPLVRALLGSEEATFTAPVRGSTGFAAQYAKQFPKDKQGRSLGQLDLVTRLQKYPCSPLIYSTSFESLPDPVRNQVWRRFKEILMGNDPNPFFKHLKKADRDAIRQILADTLPEFRAYLASGSASLKSSG